MRETHKAWADGMPLEDFFSELLTKIPVDERQANEMRVRSKQANANPATATTAIARAALTLEQMNLDKVRRKSALLQLESAMVGGKFVGYGIRRDADGVPETFQIPPTFWIDAEVSPDLNEAVNGAIKFERIKVEERGACASAPLTTNHGVEAPPEPRRRGRPTKGGFITGMIGHFVSTHESWWDVPPDERRKSYYEFLKIEHDIDPRKVQGFSEKTIQKYETEFRSKLL